MSIRTRSTFHVIAFALMFFIPAINTSAAVFPAGSPVALDIAMGTPLLPVPDDGSALGTIYGHAPAATPGIALLTPIGSMGFGPSHDRVSSGTPFTSGFFHALPSVGPIAGSTVYAPVVATALDFFIAPETIPHLFEITAVGTMSSSTILVGPVVEPTYVGFGTTGEHLILISIVKMPFPSPTTTTWSVGDIRVLPEPASLMLLLSGALCLMRRQSKIV